jgi:hypothetical protein
MRIMRTLELSISLTSIKDKKGAVIQQAHKCAPGTAAYRGDMLSPGFMSLCTHLDCERIVMLSTCREGMALLELN